ncbi:hypothetical protein ACS0TY_024129 [Phlomoides rotata]
MGVVYDNLSIQAAFETRWAEFLVKYNLQGNELLRDLYNERVSWVPIYLNHTFWAGMLSTERSEGMHAYFDEFIHSRNILKQFMEQYKIAISNKIQKEFAADFKSKNKVIKCITYFPWELKFQKTYTNDIFSLVQEEIQRMIYCYVVPPTEDEAVEDLNDVGVERIKVLERNLVNNFTLGNSHLRLSGGQSEHILIAIAENLSSRVEKGYVLQTFQHFFAGGYPHMTNEYKKFQEVEKFFQECVDASMESVEKIEYIKQLCIATKNEILNWNPILGSDNVGPSIGTSQSADVRGTPILNPQVTIPRGRPRSQCCMSAAEASCDHKFKQGQCIKGPDPPKSSYGHRD